MKTALLLFVTFFTVTANGQIARGTPQKAQEIENGTLTVLQYKKASKYNINIEEILTDRWKGKYKMMTYEEFDALKKFEGPLLSLGTGMTPTFYGASLNLRYGNDFYAMIQVNYPQPTRTTIDSVAKRFNRYSKEHLDLLFSLLLNTFNAVKSGSAGNELKLDISGKSTREFYQDASAPAKLKSGILYIPKEELKLKKPNGNKTDTELLEPGAIDALYQGKYELVNEERLAELIAEKPENGYYLHGFTEGSTGLYSIVSLEQRKIVYMDYARGAYGDVTVCKGMLKDLNKLIGN